MIVSIVAKRAVGINSYANIVRFLTKSSKDARTKELLDKIIRIDHAGEFGAKRIYQGQLAVLKDTPEGPLIKAWKSHDQCLHYSLMSEKDSYAQEMQEEEEKHLAEFERLMTKNRVRPTALLPLWNAAGFALGAGTALLGKEGAMACTVAVETVIGQHYNDQIRELMELDPESHKKLLATLKEFRDDELHHHDIGLEHDAEKAPFYKTLTEVIKVGCKGAIWVSEKI